MKKSTIETVTKNARIAYHELAVALLGGDVRSRGKSLREEVLEYVREYPKHRPCDQRFWRNMQKTKCQKDLVVETIENLVVAEFGQNVANEYAVQPCLPGLEA